MLRFLVPTIILLQFYASQARIRVDIVNANVTFNRNFINTNYSLEYQDASQDYYLTIESDFLDTFENLYSRLYLARLEKNSSIPGQKFFDVRTDVCRFFKKQNRSDLLNQLLIQMVQKFGSQIESCPLKKGHYFIRNFTFNKMKIPMERHFNKDFASIGVLQLQIKQDKRFIVIETISTTLLFKNV